MGLLQTAMTDGGKRRPRWVSWLFQMITHPRNLTWLSVRRWSEKTIILLVMQTLDNSITVSGRRTRTGRFKLTSGQGHGAPNPTWIPAGNEATRRVAKKIDGIPGGTVGEIANIPMTAHFIGGCAIGDSPDTGVIDPWHRLYGHPGLHIADGSTISANLGVNPSLTITAQAERAMAFWPNHGRADPRPPVGAGVHPGGAGRPDPPRRPRARPRRAAAPPRAHPATRRRRDRPGCGCRRERVMSPRRTLSAQDGMWLWIESPETPMQVASLSIFKPEQPARAFVRRLVEEYRKHPATARPFNYLIHPRPAPLLPTCEVVDDVEIDYHLRHSALPQPGGQRELGILVSRLHSSPLDRRRPMWELHVIEGLQGNRFAVYLKTHHALFDGVAGLQALAESFSVDPQAPLPDRRGRGRCLHARRVPPRRRACSSRPGGCPARARRCGGWPGRVALEPTRWSGCSRPPDRR